MMEREQHSSNMALNFTARFFVEVIKHYAERKRADGRLLLSRMYFKEQMASAVKQMLYQSILK